MSYKISYSFSYNRRRLLFPASGIIITITGYFIISLLKTNHSSSSAALVDVNNNVLQLSNTPHDGNFNPVGLNLLENTGQAPSSYSVNSCTQESMNSDKLQQDHPCVIDIIKRFFLHPPAAPDVPYSLTNPQIIDPSAGQSAGILKYLKNQTEGFFIECGALDGETLSNTLYMERTLNWTGVLIEADQTSFGELLSLRRKSYALPVCLSLEPYPTKVTFNVVWTLGSIQEKQTATSIQRFKGKPITLQCFPLYSILLAIGRTQIDFLSLDVEGHELRILSTIPWHKVNIKVMTVEWNHVGQQPLIDLLGSKGYYVFGRNRAIVGDDLFFARNDSLFQHVV